MTTPKPFDGLLGRLTNERRKEMIRVALINSDIEGERDLRNIVAGANRIEATTLLHNSLSGLSYQDAAVLAGLVLPQGFLPSLLPPHNHLNRTTTRPRSRNDSLSLLFTFLSSPASLCLFVFLSLSFSQYFLVNINFKCFSIFNKKLKHSQVNILLFALFIKFNLFILSVSLSLPSFSDFSSFSADTALNAVVSQLQLAFRMNRSHIGVSTEAEWVKDLEDRRLLSHEQTFDNTLILLRQSWWPRSPRSFPLLHDPENDVCQPFFDQMFEDLRCHKMHRRLAAGGYSKNPAPKNQQPKFLNEFICSPNSPTFSLRKPDIVLYQPERRGPCSITAIGDVKGRTSDGAFPNSEIGHVLDMATVLLREHQFLRVFIYCFLSDGYRFQFFKCQRQSGSVSEPFKYVQSAIYIGEAGWQVCISPFPQFTQVDLLWSVNS
jgi:hypothetical protein